MNNSIYRIAVAALGAMSFSSCEIEKEIDYDAYYDGDKLVVHCYLSDSNGLVASVHKTLPPDSPRKSNVVNDARLWLMAGNDTLAEATTDDHELYRINAQKLSLDNETEYWIIVSSNKYGCAYSDRMKIPQSVAIDTLEYDGYGSVYIYFVNAEPEECYKVQKSEYRRGSKDSFWGEYYMTAFYEKNFAVGYTCINAQVSSFYDSVRYELLHLSPELAVIFDSWRDNHSSSDDVFSEYVYPVIENIHGGHGFFGTYSSDSEWWFNGNSDVR